MASVARAEPIAARRRAAAGKTRREQVEGTLKEIEETAEKGQSVRRSRCGSTQAGLDWSKRRFMITAGVLGVGGFARHDDRARRTHSGARRRLCRRLRPAVLDVVLS